MKNSSFNRVLVGIWILAFLISGCGPGAPTPEMTATPTPGMITTPTTVQEPSSVETTTVVDSLGNEVLIPSEATKVASMRSGITEIICALGQKDKIVAVEEGTKEGAGYGAFIASIHPDLMARDCPLAGRDISAEEMLRIDPDLVLHGGYGRIKQAEAFKEQVPEMPVVIAHFETLEHYMDDIRIVAQCVNAEERAEELIAYLQSKLDFVSARVDDVSDDDKVRVFYGGHDIYHAYGGETFEHFQITSAGGVNVAADLTGWMPEVSAEQLLQWDPQVVVLLSSVSVDDVLNDPKLASLSAVKDQRVYALPESGWDFSSPRALFCIEWLASKLYPERFADVDIQSEAGEFYQSVFGVDYAGPTLVEAGAVSAVPVEMHTVTDMNGREVEIPANVSSVVSLSPDITLAVLALGGGDMLVGIDWMSPQNEALQRVFPAVEGMAEVGSFFNVNAESVLLADPDVILTVAWHQDPDKTQEMLGIPVVCIDADYYRESLALTAEVLGGAAMGKAAELVAYYEDKVLSIQAAVADVPEAERTKVYIAGSDGFLSTFGKESAWQFEIADVGAINVAADIVGGGSHEVSVEQLLLWNPAVIILDETCPDSLTDVLADSRWQSVRAVQDRRVYRASVGFMETWGRPHIESVVARIWEADKFYPERVDFDVVAEAQAFYSRFYGVDLSSAEVEALLEVE
ncbi:MAG: ABC transporter substrate-binding protein [Chloroflexota bacterium]|nr:ABC transporter substrate-binding protein [Chloroflexota bacterium]